MQTKEVLSQETVDVQLLDNKGERLLTEDCNDNTIEHLHRYAVALAFCEGRDVLDIASGEGYGSNLLAGVAKTVTGVDISTDAVAHAKAKYKRDNLDYIHGMAEEIPLPSGAVDVVVSFETIEHHDKHAEMMGEIKRVLRPGGVLIISSPDKLHYTDIPKVSNPFHVKELYKEEFRALLSGYFNNVEMLLQRVVYGSAVAPEQSAQGFVEYWGDYYQVNSSSSLRHPVYNLCLASDESLPDLPASFYDGWHILQALIKSIHALRENDRQLLLASASYRLGRALTWPVRKLLGK